MVAITQLVNYCDKLLNVVDFKDYCHNGQQVSGKSLVNNIVSAVSLNTELIHQAIAAKADMLLLHHGAFWRGDNLTLTGVARARIALLLEHDISVVAYHLPLDVHNVYGNNTLLGKKMSWVIDGSFPLFGTADLGVWHTLKQPCSWQQLQQQLHTLLEREPLHLPAGNNKLINKVAWCSGAAQDGITAAKECGADAFISGEVSERTYHLAKELDIHYFVAGHHATECFGVAALGAHLAEKFGLQHQFINIYNPI